MFGNKDNLLVKNFNVNEGIYFFYMDSSKVKELLDFLIDYNFVIVVEEIYLLMWGLDDVLLWY